MDLKRSSPKVKYLTVYIKTLIPTKTKQKLIMNFRLYKKCLLYLALHKTSRVPYYVSVKSI